MLKKERSPNKFVWQLVGDSVRSEGEEKPKAESLKTNAFYIKDKDGKPVIYIELLGGYGIEKGEDDEGYS